MTIQRKVETPEPAEAELDADTLRGIRALMEKNEAEAAPQPAAAPRGRSAKESPAAEGQEPEAPAPAPERKPASSKAAFAPLPEAEEEPEAARPRRSLAGFRSRLALRPGKPRFKLRHAFYAALALLVLLRPVLVIGLLILTGLIMVGVFLIMGYDSFWRRAMALGRWYARRRPQKAAVLHARLDRFAVWWDQFLDRFPEGTVDGLYLPDFGELAEADARHDAALERRLSNLRGG